MMALGFLFNLSMMTMEMMRKQTHKVCAGKQSPLSPTKVPIQQRLHLLTNASSMTRTAAMRLDVLRPHELCTGS